MTASPIVLPVEPLYVPRPSDAYALPLDIALQLARKDLAVQQDANIHDNVAMVRAAVTLEIRLRQLLAALDVDAADKRCSVYGRTFEVHVHGGDLVNETPLIPEGPFEAEPRVPHLGKDTARELITDALTAAGVRLGAYDRRIVAWQAGWDTSSIVPLVSWLRQAAARVAELEAQLAEYGRPADEDPIALSLTPKADGITRRIAPTQAHREDEPEQPAQASLTVFRAQHDSIVMGLYTTAAEARAHCVAEERRAWAKSENPVFDWIEDEEDGVAELVTVNEDGETESFTGYVVTLLEVASKFDEGADE